MKGFAQAEHLKLVEASAKTGNNIELIFEVMAFELESGSQTELEVEEEKATYEFLLKYNRADFDLGRKKKCCHI